MTDVIRAERLTKYYGRRRGIDGLDLAVRAGEIYGFLGPNGAGKTTTIRLLVDLIRPTSGQAWVLDEPPRAGGRALRRRIGYLSGDFVVDGGQSVRELLIHLGHLRGGIQASRVASLADRFELELDARIGRLSKGNRQKVGIVQAFMHEPELLILDEPTGGLDPIMQQRFLDLARETRAAGQTVFMSSHVLSEVQQSADRVGIVRDGSLIAEEAVESLRARAVRRVEVRFDVRVDPQVLAAVDGVSEVRETDGIVRCHLAGRADPLVKVLGRYPVSTLVIEEPDLEELFLTYYRSEPHAQGAGDAA